MKTFRGDLVQLQDRLRAGRPFAFARFGDGELDILRGYHLDGRAVIGGHEFTFVPGDPADAACRQRLWDALRYRHPDYYVGISCPCCVGEEQFTWLRHASQQDEAQLTWATLFFYANYRTFLDRVLPLFAHREVFLVCHRSADPERLPFVPSRVFPIGYNAWREEVELVDEIAGEIAERRLEGALFLFCAGPFGCILAHRLHACSPANTYLDLGSPLDPFLFTGWAARNRRYLKQTPEIRDRTACTWLPRT